MSVRHLVRNANYTVGASNEKAVVVAPLSVHEEVFTSFNPTSFSLSTNSTVDIYPPSQSILDDLRFRATLTNAHPTDTLRYKTVYDFIEEIKLKLNNTEILRYNNSDEVKFQYSEWFLEHSKDQAELDALWCVFNNIISTGGLQYTNVLPTQSRVVDISFVPLLPFLYRANSCGMQKITFDIRWKSTQGAPADINQWIMNATANTNIAPSVQFSNAEFKTCYHHSTQHSKHNGRQTFALTLFEVNKKSLNLSVLNSKQRFNLGNDYSNRKKVSSVYVLGYDRTNNSAYNSGPALTHADTFGSLGLKHLLKGRENKELNTHAERAYERISRDRRHGRRFNPFNTTNDDYFAWNFIDLTHTHGHDNVDQVEGIHNDSNSNHEIELTVNSALQASNDLLVAIKYKEILEISPDGTVKLMN